MLLGSLIDLVYFCLLVLESPYGPSSWWFLGLSSVGLEVIFLDIDFIPWLVVRNRLQTPDRITRWSSGIMRNCMLCTSGVKLRDHLFFKCLFSNAI